jgi:hypothetical protein
MAAAPTGTYVGKDSDAKKVSLKVSGQKIKRFTIGWTAACDDGSALTGTFHFKTFPRNGRRFSAGGGSGGVLPDGRDYSQDVSLSGRFTRSGKKATGVFRIATEVQNASGGGVGRCSSGKVTYTVKKKS